MNWKDAIGALFAMGMVLFITYLIIRMVEPERDPDSAIVITNAHQASAIICNRAIPPQVRPHKGVTFA